VQKKPVLEVFCTLLNFRRKFATRGRDGATDSDQSGACKAGQGSFRREQVRMPYSWRDGYEREISA